MLHPRQHAEFTESEARALIGQSVQTIAPFRRLPLRTRGRILTVSQEIPQRVRSLVRWCLIVEWELPDHKAAVRDWIAKWELEEYLQVVEE